VRATSEADGVRRPRISWRTALLAGLVLLACLGYLHLAARKFAWWTAASFAGDVTGKEARWRETGTPATEAAALENPHNCRFFLKIADHGDTATHEVTPEVFRATHVGDHVVKAAGSYQVRRVPGEPAPPGGPRGGT
jgi:hypothetical protein